MFTSSREVESNHLLSFFHPSLDPRRRRGRKWGECREREREGERESERAREGASASFGQMNQSTPPVTLVLKFLSILQPQQLLQSTLDVI